MRLNEVLIIKINKFDPFLDFFLKNFQLQVKRWLVIMEKIVIKLILICSLVEVVFSGTAQYNIPPTSPTRHQFIAGELI